MLRPQRRLETVTADSELAAHRADGGFSSMEDGVLLEDAIYQTVLYADLFDFPLTRDEIFVYLVGNVASRLEVERALDRMLACDDMLESDGTYVYVRGRAEIVATRLGRAGLTLELARRARFYGHVMWSLPFVRMVAVTGTVAAQNAKPGDDIDYLIVTSPGRLWTVRGMAVLLCKLARLRGDELCPNYLLSERALALEEQDLYSAHELAQMIPLHGTRTADLMWAENEWYRRFLPNARNRLLSPVTDSLPPPVLALKQLGEFLLGFPFGARVERWECNRKILKFSAVAESGTSETRFRPDVCKGHFHSHRRFVLRLFAARVASRGPGNTPCR